MRKMILLVSCVWLAACSPAVNQAAPNLSATEIDSVVASSKKSCTDELTKQSGAEGAEKICGCASTKVGEALKKDPSAASDDKKFGELLPGVISACVKELAASPAASPSPSASASSAPAN
jgi:hypothetical protein